MIKNKIFELYISKNTTILIDWHILAPGRKLVEGTYKKITLNCKDSELCLNTYFTTFQWQAGYYERCRIFK